jgi:hypothetical protein
VGSGSAPGGFRVGSGSVQGRLRVVFGNLNCKGYMEPEILLSPSTCGRDFNAFFDLNNFTHR